MKYFLDTEFLEGKQSKILFGIKVGETKPTIDLISIGIVCEDGREYYAISKDFNLKEAWNRYDLKPDIDNGGYKKVYWIRENVLLPIYKEFVSGDARNHIEFSYEGMKYVINHFGMTNEEISLELQLFCNPNGENYANPPEFYAYYADYDWVSFCWLFGKMIDLPKGFPKYCNDLKQEMDYVAKNKSIVIRSKTDGFSERTYFLGDHYKTTFKDMIGYIKSKRNYPEQKNEHNALDDARWNKKLYEFIESL